MFRKLNKPQLTQIKQQNCIGIMLSILVQDLSSEKNCLYLDISSVPNVHLWSVWFVITCGRFVSYFCIARIGFKSWRTCQFWT